MSATELTLDAPERISEIRQCIDRKKALRELYLEYYGRYRECLAKCPKDGIALELGSGGGFAKDVIPELLTSDVIAYSGVDQVVDATKMPFADESLRAIFMLDVFHHIPDAEKFLSEAMRCLKPGGRILIIDEHIGLISKPVLKYVHHEGFDPKATRWAFESSGPLSSANGALAWIVFQRDRATLAEKFPGLELVRYTPHTPLRYWMIGGLKKWCLVPGWGFAAARALDHFLLKLTPNFGSFVDIELVKKS